MSFEHAAAVGIAGVTALQGLRDKGRLHEGQHVLINGASGGVGTWGLQIAKAMGGEVTAVCSPRNVEQARQLGADRVIDYTEQDFTQNGRRYDLLLDIGGNRSWPEYKRALNADGTIVIVGGPKTNRWIGPLWDRLLVRLRAIRDSRTVAAPFLASLNGDDLRIIGEWMESGNVTPAIERTYPLSEVPQALAYVGEGHARGKVVISIRES